MLIFKQVQVVFYQTNSIFSKLSQDNNSASRGPLYVTKMANIILKKFYVSTMMTQKSLTIFTELDNCVHLYRVFLQSNKGDFSSITLWRLPI